MIRKLRKKLIAVSMVSLCIVLFCIFGFVGLLNYRKMVSDADHTLSILADNDGTFPEPKNDEPDHAGKLPDAKDPSQPDPSSQDAGSASSASDSSANSDPSANTDPGNLKSSGKSGKTSALPESKQPSGNPKDSPELPFESRYFSVLLDSNDASVLSTDTGMIAAVDEDTAAAYATSIFKSEKTKGFLHSYRYTTVTSDSGTRVIFLDCQRTLSSFHTLVFTSVSVCLIGMLLVLLLMFLLSGYIIKPFIENHEKQKQFITDAGHELKTPLTIINADAEILEMDYGSNEWLADIQEQTKHLTSLTNNLITLSRMEEERTRLQMIDFPFSDVVEETVQSFQALARTQNKTFETSIQPMISLYGDEKSLTQIVSILLDNAMKYSTPEGEISLCLEKAGNNVKLSVYNTADSIDREQLPHLFDRFYRTDKSRNSETGGYGLGLSIAAAVVNTHKGKITATTQDEHSLLITVTLPLKTQGRK